MVDGSSGDKKSLDEMRRFKPDIFILAQMMNPHADCGELKCGPEKFDLERHVDAVKVIIATYERRPYLVAICGDDRLNKKIYRRFAGVCEEFGFDHVCRRGEVNGQKLAFWVHRARRSGGQSK